MSEEPEAELQATASLSPVSPSPVHTASPLVVPALQDTVDSIDAMVAAAAAAASDDAPSSGGPNDGTNGQTMRPGNGVEIQNGLAPGPDRRHEQQQTQPPAVSPIYHDEPGSDPQDFVDDDNDPYGDDTTSQGNAPAAVNPAPAQNQDPDDADDYAKIFDSPINPDEGEDADDNYPEPAQQHNVPPSTVPSSRVPATAAGTSSTVAPLSSNLADVAHSSSSAAQPKADTQPSIDLQKLLADLSLPNPSLSSSTPPEPSASHSAAAPASPPSSSLPPRPPQPNAAAQSYPAQHHPAGTSTAASSAPPSEPASPGMPPRSGKASGQRDGSQPGSRSNTRQQWSQYLNDERQYMTEAKWDRFPEGSRIFIGNLSSDKVSKREVFNLFNKCGRLAQISLKSAYGFVQFHTSEAGRKAIETLQDYELRGRPIHLEVSKLQDKPKRERARSPENGRGGRDGGRRNEKRDERRSRNRSPRRGEFRQESLGRDRGFHDSYRGGRARSRSPGYGGRNGRDSYRRRSPSPYAASGRSSRHGPHDSVELDLPRRYGADVPDVQLILEDGVSREFVDWVEGAFKVKGLSTHSMFLHARMPKNQVIQRQAAEGVHAVVELDVRVERTGKIPMQAFDRSSGGANVRFDQYVDLDPSIAAQVILRTKASSVGPIGYTQPPPATTYGYPQAYGAPSAAVPYGQPAYPIQQPQQPQQPQQQQQEIAALLSSVDPATLQQVLSSLQPQQHPLQLQTTLQPQPGLAGMPPSMPGGGPQPDIQALLSTLGVPASAPSAPAPMPGAPAQYPGAPYAAQPPLHPHHQHAQPPPSGDAAQVQNIMAQLARYR